MYRRSYATFMRPWPGKTVMVTSPRISFDEYLERYSYADLTTDEVITILVGDLQRIRVNAQRGFQIPQQIPDEVGAAFEALVVAGYDRHLVKPS